MLGFLGAISVVHAAQYYSVSAGGSRAISEWGICENIINNNGLAIFVPTNSSGEWSSFYNHGASSVSVNSCSYGCSDSSAANYNSSANVNDGSCLYHKCFDVGWTGYATDEGFDAGYACSVNNSAFDPYGTSGSIHATCDATGGSCNDNGLGVNDYWVGSCNDSGAGIIGAYLGGGANDLMIHIDSNSGLYNCQ